MSAWDALIAGSTIEVGDAWEHLLAQGGEGGGEVVYIGGVLSVDVTLKALSTLTVETLSTNIINVPLAANVENIARTAETEKNEVTL